MFSVIIQSDLIRSQSGDLNPGPPGTKQPLYHLSYHPLTWKHTLNKYNLKLLCPFLNYITNPPGLPIEQVCFHINQSSNLIKLSFVHLLRLKKYFHFRKKLRPCCLFMQSFISFLFYCSRPPTFYKPDKKNFLQACLFHLHSISIS